MASIIYFVRTKSSVNNKKVNIRIRFRHGRDIDLNSKTAIEVMFHHFNNKTHSIRKVADNVNYDKDTRTLQLLKNRIIERFKELQSNPTGEWLRKVVDEFHYPEKYMEEIVTLTTFIDQFIEDAKNDVNSKTERKVSYKTLRDYEAAKADLIAFSESKKVKLDFKNIDKDFYKKFKNYLASEKKNVQTGESGLAKNTVGKKIQVLKTFLNAASPKYLSSDQFKDFTASTEESNNIYFNEDELETIYNYDFSQNERLERVRDMFMIGCWTGCRFDDWRQVKKENIQDGNLHIWQKKTGEEAVIPIHTVVEEILAKYNGTLPELISNQKFNAYLKEVIEEVELKKGITKRITRGGERTTTFYQVHKMTSTHTARRSFATNQYKLNMPVATIMSATGHKSESAFFKYIKTTKEEHAEKMRDHWVKRTKEKEIEEFDGKLKIAK